LGLYLIYLFKIISLSHALYILIKNDLNPDTFLRAKAPVILDTLKYIRSEFGSVDGFLDKNGFDETWRDKLRKNIGSK